MGLHPNSFGLTWCGEINVLLWILSRQVLCIKRFNRKQRLLCKANSTVTCFSIAQIKDTNLFQLLLLEPILHFREKNQGQQVFQLNQKRNQKEKGAFWLLHLTICRLSGGAFGRVKTRLRHVSVSFAQKNLQIFLVLISMPKLTSKPDNVKTSS